MVFRQIWEEKTFVVAGYSPTAILKPLLYFAQTSFQVLAIRIPERAGKGFRGAPRDALIAESVDKKDLGKAFGFHRALDTVGAVIGSFLGFVFLIVITGNASELYRLIFVISAIPAAISVIIAQVFVIEKKPIITARKSSETVDQKQLEYQKDEQGATKAAAEDNSRKKKHGSFVQSIVLLIQD